MLIVLVRKKSYSKDFQICRQGRIPGGGCFVGSSHPEILENSQKNACSYAIESLTLGNSNILDNRYAKYRVIKKNGTPSVFTISSNQLTEMPYIYFLWLFFDIFGK